jgi:hypothetical protein
MASTSGARAQLDATAPANVKPAAFRKLRRVVVKSGSPFSRSRDAGT